MSSAKTLPRVPPQRGFAAAAAIYARIAGLAKTVDGLASMDVSSDDSGTVLSAIQCVASQMRSIADTAERICGGDPRLLTVDEWLEMAPVDSAFLALSDAVSAAKRSRTA